MRITHQTGDPRGLVLLDENARFMKQETFAALVRQIRKDGVLQQWPFIWHDLAQDRRVVLSGNHRVKAAIEAGLDVIDWTECDEPLTHDERIRIQLGHNAIAGEDDPTVLQRLYESINDTEERLATGIDDATLALFAKVDTSSLAEANLDFTTLSIVFLPDEYDRALAAFDEAKRLGLAQHRWTAHFDQHQRTLAAVEDARDSVHVVNVAAALGVLLDVWDAHRDDLQAGWLDADQELVGRPKDDVPLTSVFGMSLHAEDAQLVAKAVKKMVARGAIDRPAEALTLWARAYLDS